ncbi:MAG: flagellar hook-associated protein FlgK, partial [Proteobacteria bacterium]
QQVINAADALAQRMNAVSQLLASQRAAVAQQRIATVSQINGLAKDIADLNTQIVIANGTGINASGLIDTRDRKLDELASLVALQVVEQPDGSRSVALRGGQPLVVGGHAATVTAAFNADGSQSLSLSLAQEVFSLDDTALGGELGGLQELERDVLAPLMRSLAEMAQQLADNVNAQLAAGYTPDGAPGQPLFAVDISGDIGLLRINPNLGGADLAFSAVPGEPGNSDNLRALIALRDQPVTLSLLGSVTLSDAVTQLVGRLGMDSQQNQSALDTARAVRNQAEESWKSTSGVNLDEEAINLMQYQQMYESNMKVIAVANELFDSTLAMLR